MNWEFRMRFRLSTNNNNLQAGIFYHPRKQRDFHRVTTDPYSSYAIDDKLLRRLDERSERICEQGNRREIRFDEYQVVKRYRTECPSTSVAIKPERSWLPANA